MKKYTLRSRVVSWQGDSLESSCSPLNGLNQTHTCTLIHPVFPSEGEEPDGQVSVAVPWMHTAQLGSWKRRLASPDGGEEDRDQRRYSQTVRNGRRIEAAVQLRETGLLQGERIFNRVHSGRSQVGVHD